MWPTLHSVSFCKLQHVIRADVADLRNEFLCFIVADGNVRMQNGKRVSFYRPVNEITHVFRADRLCFPSLWLLPR
jgi:hypothetical protein